MILDESMTMKLGTEVKVSRQGAFFQATSLEFKHPEPRMAKGTFKMKRYFSQMLKDQMRLMTQLSPEAIKDQTEQVAINLQAGESVKAIHQEYADGDDVAREAKLKEIEDMVSEFIQIADLSDEVDLYQMTVDFGKMVIANKRCVLKGKDESDSECSEPLTLTLWEQEIDPGDRLMAAIRYCCFFGLTSSMSK